MALHPWPFVSDIAIFVLKGDVKLELTIGFRPQACMQRIRCSLLLHMSHLAWSVSVCISVYMCSCWAHGSTVQKKHRNWSRCHLGGWLVGPRNNLLDGRQDQTNSFAATMVMRPLPNYFAHLLWYIVGLEWVLMWRWKSWVCLELYSWL